jgi:hypothetical protein
MLVLLTACASSHASGIDDPATSTEAPGWTEQECVYEDGLWRLDLDAPAPVIIWMRREGGASWELLPGDSSTSAEVVITDAQGAYLSVGTNANMDGCLAFVWE